MSTLRTMLGALVVLAGTFIAGLAQASPPPGDPPARAGRIAEFDGGTWVFDQDQGQWSPAMRNRALAEGDRVSTSPEARATLQIGSLRIWIGPRSEIELLQLDERGLQLQLHNGSAVLRVRSRESAEQTALFTREARFRPLRAGLYRFDRIDDTTFAGTERGDLMLEDSTSMPIGPGVRIELWRDARAVLQQRNATWPQDALQQRVAREEGADERSASLRYVSPEITGVEELDRYGRWERHPEFGMVWAPVHVSVGWAPFRDGRWVWLRHWGWTWVDNQPWGFATSHYGRWVPVGPRWVWAPGSHVGPPIFVPGVVAWVGGPTVSIGISIGGGHRPLPGSAWVPLPLAQPWRPWYPATPVYVERINREPWPQRGHGHREPRPHERPAWPVAPGLHSGPLPPPVLHTPGHPAAPTMRHTPRLVAGDDRPAPSPIQPPAQPPAGGVALPAPVAPLHTPPAYGPPVNSPPAQRAPGGPGHAERPTEAGPARPTMRIPAPVVSVAPPAGVAVPAPAPGATPPAPPRTRGPAVRDPEAPEERRARSPEARQGLRNEREHLR